MKAFITGIDGQDGSYLAELLLDKGYEVYGLRRRKASGDNWRVAHIEDELKIVDGDLLDYAGLINILSLIKPDEIYNLAAQSFVGGSFNTPSYTAQVTGIGALNIIEAMRHACPKSKILQASSSEQFGKTKDKIQDENTVFYPRSPYGCAKVFAHNIFVNYRESYNLFACCSICFNHESPRRGEEFVTRKITKGLAEIVAGKRQKLLLGNLDTARDWGHAKDYVRAMWLILQQQTPSDFVVATGELHTLRQFISVAFAYSGLKGHWQDYIGFDSLYTRPADVQYLLGNSHRAQDILGWKQEILFDDLVKEMIVEDINRYKHRS